MKQRIISMIAAVAMLLSILPIAYAENENTEDEYRSKNLIASEYETDDLLSYETKLLENEKQCSDRFIVKYKAPNQGSKKDLKDLSKKIFKQLKQQKQTQKEQWQGDISDEEIKESGIKTKNKKMELFSIWEVDTAQISADRPEIETITLEESVDTQAFVKQIEESMGGIIEYIQPDIQMETSANDITDSIPAVINKDENLSSAQSKSEGAGVTVALIDSSVDINHADLTEHLITGWDFSRDGELIYSGAVPSSAMHGTHIAGIIAQSAPEAKIMPLKVFEDGKAYTSDIIKAIEYAEENGADIVNCSWGNTAENPALKEAMENSNMFFVAAAGNSRVNLDQTPVYPASYGLENIINVASVNQDGGMSYFSNYGESVDIAAWGRDVYSTMPNNEYGNMNGTSMSAGYVTGAAALAVANGEDIHELKSILKSRADKVSVLEGKVDNGNIIDFANVIYKTIPIETMYIDVEDDFDRWKEKMPEENWKLFNSLENIQVAAGSGHSVVLKSDGTVWTWGNNSNGQLGNGAEIKDDVPKPVIGLSNVSDISAYGNHTMALKSDGTVWMWGFNNYGELGDGTTVDKYYPTKVLNLPAIKIPENEYEHTISISNSHALVVDVEGKVWAWGWKAFGCLGDGEEATGGKYIETIPIIVHDISDIKSIEAGNLFSLAIGIDGYLWGWGMNDRSELGVVGGKNKYLIPQKTTFKDVKMVSSSEYHSIAIKEDGTAWTWGYNLSGQTGTVNINQEVTSPNRLSNFSSVDKCCASNSMSIILTNDGYVWSCGSGYLGGGGSQIYPEYISSQHAKALYLNNIKSIASTFKHTLALDENGVIWVWGSNSLGQLGNQTQVEAPCPKKITDKDGSNCFLNPKSVASNNGVSLVLDGDGTVWAWGENNYGQLGDGTNINRDNPERVKNADGSGYLENIKMITAEEKYCLALAKDGTVWTWGNARNVEETSGLPSRVISEDGTGYLSDVISIASGYYANMALKENGTIVTWKGSATPSLVNLNNIKAVAAGQSHCLALKNDGTIYGWGHNSSGQLGIGGANSEEIKTPEKVRGGDGSGYLNNIVAIDAGRGFSVALDKDGYVWNWGDSSRNQLGSGGTNLTIATNITCIPTKVCNGTKTEYLSNICSINTNRYSTLALSSDKFLYGWGDNNCGQITCEYKLLDNISEKNEYFSDIKIPDNSCESTISMGYYHSLLIKEDGTVWSFGYNKYELTEDGKLNFTDVPCRVNGIVNNVYDDVIVSIDTDPIIVKEKTTVEELNLPSQVMVTLDNGLTDYLSITWDTSTYNSEQIGEQTLHGDIQLKNGIINPNNIRAEIKIIIKKNEQKIASIFSQKIITDQGLVLGIGEKPHSIGGTATTVDVPQTVMAHLDDNSTMELSVIWDDSTYKPYQTGTQTIYGHIQTVDGISNPDDIKASLEITVTPATYEVYTASPETISADVIQGTPKDKLYDYLSPKTVDIEAANCETGDVVYIYSDYTLSDEYEENVNYNPEQLGVQNLKGRFHSSITDNFQPPYVDIEANVVASTISNVVSVEMNAYQSFEFNDNTVIPQQVTVELENGLTTQVDVEWNTNNYAKDIAGDQIIMGKLVNLPSGVLQTDPEKVATLIVHVQAVDYKITSVISDIMDVEMDAGYGLDEVYNRLPDHTAKVKIESTTDGLNLTTEYDMPFVLEEENNTEYDAQTASLYILTGTFNLPGNISNPDNYDHQIFLQTMAVAIQTMESAYATTTMGTEFEDIEKPAQIYVTLENGEKVWLDVNWGTGDGYISDSDELTEDHPIQSTVYGELVNKPDYIDIPSEPPTLIITVILPKVYYINSISPVRIPETGVIDVNLGSSLEEIYNVLGTHSVTIELRNLKNVISTQEATFTLRTEDNPDYDSMSENEAELKAYLNLPENVENPDDKQLIVAVKPTKYTVKNVIAIKIKGIEAGTPFEEIGLPENAPVKYTDGSEGALPTTWNSSMYIPTKIGAQTIRGTFNLPLPVYAENPNNRQPLAGITVVDPSVTILSAIPLENEILSMPIEFAMDVDETIPELMIRNYLVELLHEDGNVTTEVMSVFDEIEA